MRSRLHTAADRIRRPEYTGETAVCPARPRTSPSPPSGASCSTSLPRARARRIRPDGGRYLASGSLVPGTPELTRQYFPDWLLRTFEKDPQTATFGTEAATDGEFESERFLRETGLLVDDSQRGDAAVEPAFGAMWRERMGAVGGEAERSELAALLEVDPDRLDLARHGDAVTARLDGRRVRIVRQRGAEICRDDGEEVSTGSGARRVA